MLGMLHPIGFVRGIFICSNCNLTNRRYREIGAIFTSIFFSCYNHHTIKMGMIRMKLKSIVAELRCRWPESMIRVKNPECDLNGIALGSGIIEHTAMIHVYLNPSAEITAGCAEDECCICLADCNAANLILAQDDQMLEEMVNLIQHLFSKLQELGRLLQTTLTKQLNLQSIISRATDILDNPMLVADPNNEIIAISDVDWDDSAWKRFQEQRCLPYHPDMAQAYAKFVEQVGRGKLIEVVDGRHKKAYFIRGAVVDGLNLIGQLHVFSWKHEFTEFDVELVSMLCGILAAEIVCNSENGGAIRSSSDYFISDLIRGNLRNPELVEARLAYLNWNLRQYKYLLLVQWGREDNNIDFRDACMRSLNSIFPDGRCVLDGMNMVVLFSTEAKLTANSSTVDLINAYLGKIGLVAVLSMPFTDVWDAVYYYDQSCDILGLNQRLGREDQFLMAEASAFELLLQEASKKYHLIDYCHPLVRSLMEYDQREGKDYLTTLRAFTIAGMNYTKAAELLHMHRNSVIYRMKQIEEILDFDFSSMEFGFHIDLSFRILDYIESTESHRWSRKEDSGGERF